MMKTLYINIKYTKVKYFISVIVDSYWVSNSYILNNFHFFNHS